MRRMAVGEREELRGNLVMEQPVQRPGGKREDALFEKLPIICYGLF